MNKTKWFNGMKFAPAHIGVYERMNDWSVVVYSYWDGVMWGLFNSVLQQAYEHRDEKSMRENLNWRGLTEEAVK